uniref:Uncharacterized protein n=1 Tax=Tanacetum cinerariifolium TaxID=118510 RepID=A0A699JLH4_TANCI|nr:hypothetical protein [Tanacetum cinerariifolium]
MAAAATAIIITTPLITPHDSHHLYHHPITISSSHPTPSTPQPPPTSKSSLPSHHSHHANTPPPYNNHWCAFVFISKRISNGCVWILVYNNKYVFGLRRNGNALRVRLGEQETCKGTFGIADSHQGRVWLLFRQHGCVLVKPKPIKDACGLTAA